MKKILLAAAALTPLLASEIDPAKRLGDAATVFSEVMAAPDNSIPPNLLEHAYCIVIVPDGKGYLFCRNNAGPGWSAPGTVRIEGKSFPLQNGGTSTNLIMLVMNQRRAEQMLASKFTLGAEASVAAGPVGRTGMVLTDAQIRADVLSWSRSQGVFAGQALEGVTLWQVVDDNAVLYGGNKLENRDIVTEGVLPPKSAGKILDLLNQYSFWRPSGIPR
jgi:SH3 domain-containing YSC84-like protein 1